MKKYITITCLAALVILGTLLALGFYSHKQDIKQTALKEYRQSVVDLIKVVRTALEAEQTQEQTNE